MKGNKIFQKSRKKMVITILLILLICSGIFLYVFPSNSVASDFGYFFTNRYKNGDFGYLYRYRGGQGTIESPIYDYTINRENDYYCMKGDTPLNQENTFSTRIDIMKQTSANNVAAVSFRSDDGLTQDQSLKAVQWLVKNMYYEGASANEQTIMRSNLVKIIKKYGTDDSVTSLGNLDGEFIGVIQQFVVWHFVNHTSNSNYYQNAINSETDIKKFVRTKNENIEESFVTDAMAKQGYQLYIALVNGAKANATGTNTYTMSDYKKPNISLEGNTKNSITLGSNDKSHVRVGPITIDAKLDEIDSITDSLSIYNGTQDLKITGKKYYNKSNTVVNNLKSLIDQEYYIEFDVKNNNNVSVNLEYEEITVSYNVTAIFNAGLTSCTGNIYSGSGIQPLLEIEKQVKQDTKRDSINFIKGRAKREEIDLALTKEIVDVERNGTSVYNENRLRQIGPALIAKRGTAGYIMNKDPVPVKVGDYVTYKITVYNEGEYDAYVKEITDYLPDGLTYKEYDNERSNIKSSNVSIKSNTDNKVVIGINLENGKGKEIKKYGSDGLKKFSIFIKCWVRENAPERKSINKCSRN